MKLQVALALIILLISACRDDDDTSLSRDEQLALDIEIIENYLDDKDITAERTSSGLHYRIIETGNGTYANVNSTVEVKYRGYLTNNLTFDKTAEATTLKFELARTIEGWREGIPLIESGGGKGQLFVPSVLGYGSNPPFNSPIPENAVLIFDVTVIGFE